MQDLELLGVPGSPYTRKMLALLRYRRIPHRMIWGSHFEPLANYPVPKVKLLPTFYFPSAKGKEAVVDSTPIIERLEREHADRRVVPDESSGTTLLSACSRSNRSMMGVESTTASLPLALGK